MMISQHSSSCSSPSSLPRRSKTDDVAVRKRGTSRPLLANFKHMFQPVWLSGVSLITTPLSKAFTPHQLNQFRFVHQLFFHPAAEYLPQPVGVFSQFFIFNDLQRFHLLRNQRVAAKGVEPCLPGFRVSITSWFDKTADTGNTPPESAFAQNENIRFHRFVFTGNQFTGQAMPVCTSSAMNGTRCCWQSA